MEDQDINQDPVVIEMDFLDPRPFAERAAVPTLPREGTRQHRIAPLEPVGALDGRQIRRLSVHPPHERRDSPTGEGPSEESSVQESEEELEVTEAQRRWFRYRETRGIEDRRAPMSTEYKRFVIICLCMAILLILAIVLYSTIGRNSGQWESDGGNVSVSTPLDDLLSSMWESVGGNMSVSTPLDDLRSSMYEAF